MARGVISDAVQQKLAYRGQCEKAKNASGPCAVCGQSLSLALDHDEGWQSISQEAVISILRSTISLVHPRLVSRSVVTQQL